MANADDPFFSTLPPEHAGVARAGDDGDEIHLPAFAAHFPRLESEWLPLRWQPESMDLTPAFRDGLVAFATGQEKAAHAILTAIANALPALSQTYGEDLAARYAPALAESLVPLAITLHDTGGAVLVGLELDCDWDPESGLGLLLSGDRVLGVGFADVSFSPAIAREAAGGETSAFLWASTTSPTQG
ncbi:hypothetical protein GCM10007301_23890 [Azorhizobium oxalatiphilum]|uniref:DUF6985 domain-containing protein n=1 Tax=Azorhizobium oxalatiphilum TaxID=980631 RepID=A0A917BYN5_9HYPH|nr:hypothetical protein [Azorhizobium oxalatiphilum]GGF63286.1 hypothetical protein GCM10007301_23890 [Azorhizobium oxalatiphilum]